MSSTNNINTEEKILSAAAEIFQEKGYDGARMQEIADKANINKGLLHYYFKTKDILFDAIFSIALKRMVSNIHSILAMELPLEEKMDMIIDGYMNLLLRNATLPRFVINELSKDADRFIAKHLNSSANSIFIDFDASVKKEVNAGRIKQIDSRHLFMNLISLIVFPFVGKPMLQVIISIDNKEFHALMQERREAVKSFMKMALRP